MNDDTLDLPDEDSWVAEQRSQVIEYLHGEGVKHRDVGEWPAWHLLPYLAIWAVESCTSPGRVGWWVVSGDVPTDYVGFSEADHPREAMRHFAHQWTEVSCFMLRGEPHPNITIGTPEQWPELGVLLKARAELLSRFVDDDTIWENDAT